MCAPLRSSFLFSFSAIFFFTFFFTFSALLSFFSLSLSFVFAGIEGVVREVGVVVEKSEPFGSYGGISTIAEKKV